MPTGIYDRSVFKLPPEERFWAKVDFDGPNECWLWTAAHDLYGYGQFSFGKGSGRHHGSHRLAYLWLRGPIPEGLRIDHLCRVRNCVNPFHMEIVTNRENLMRGPTTKAAINAAKTTCLNGHPFDQVYKNRAGFARSCSICKAAAHKRRTATPKS